MTGPVRPQPKMTSTPNDAPIDWPVAIDAHGSAPTTATITGIEMRLTAPFSSTDRPKRPMPRERSAEPPSPAHGVLAARRASSAAREHLLGELEHVAQHRRAHLRAEQRVVAERVVGHAHVGPAPAQAGDRAGAAVVGEVLGVLRGEHERDRAAGPAGRRPEQRLGIVEQLQPRGDAPQPSPG